MRPKPAWRAEPQKRQSQPRTVGHARIVAVPADPEVGLAYRQEYYAGQAEDKAKVLALDAQANGPFGSFEGVLQTEDTNPLSDPPQVEHKFYARDVGPVLVIGISGGSGREELLSYTP